MGGLGLGCNSRGLSRTLTLSQGAAALADSDRLRHGNSGPPADSDAWSRIRLGGHRDGRTQIPIAKSADVAVPNRGAAAAPIPVPICRASCPVPAPICIRVGVHIGESAPLHAIVRLGLPRPCGHLLVGASEDFSG